MNEAVFYPYKNKILINAYFYSFWISIEEFKKYNIEYIINKDKNKDKNNENYTWLTEFERIIKNIQIK